MRRPLPLTALMTAHRSFFVPGRCLLLFAQAVLLLACSVQPPPAIPLPEPTSIRSATGAWSMDIAPWTLAYMQQPVNDRPGESYIISPSGFSGVAPRATILAVVGTRHRMARIHGDTENLVWDLFTQVLPLRPEAPPAARGVLRDLEADNSRPLLRFGMQADIPDPDGNPLELRYWVGFGNGFTVMLEAVLPRDPDPDLPAQLEAIMASLVFAPWAAYDASFPLPETAATLRLPGGYVVQDLPESDRVRQWFGKTPCNARPLGAVTVAPVTALLSTRQDVQISPLIHLRYGEDPDFDKPGVPRCGLPQWLADQRFTMASLWPQAKSLATSSGEPCWLLARMDQQGGGGADILVSRQGRTFFCLVSETAPGDLLPEDYPNLLYSLLPGEPAGLFRTTAAGGLQDSR